MQAIAGQTIAQIVQQHCILKSNAIGAVVQINGHQIPRHLWHVVRPKPGTLVTINVVPQGGGGGDKKNPLATVLSLAVVVAAPYAVAAIGSATLGTSATALTLAGRAVAAGIGVVGSLLVNAIAPPPQASGGNFASTGGFQDAEESRTQFIEGARNEITRYGVVPINLGTNRVFPLQAASPYTITKNGVNSIAQLFTYGYGKVLVTDIKIGETAINQFRGVQIQHRLNADLDSGTELFTNDIQQDQYSAAITTSYTTRTTRIDSDAAIVDVLFPRGLVQYNDAGNRTRRSVQIEVTYAATGVIPQVWSVGYGFYTSVASQSVALSFFESILIRNGSVWESYAAHIIYLDRYTGTAKAVRAHYLGNSIAEALTALSYVVLPGDTIRLASVVTKSTTPFPLTSSPVWTNSIVYLNDDRQASLYGNELQNSSSFVPSISGNNVAISAGGAQLGNTTVTNATAEPFIVSYTIKFPSTGQYDIRVRRIDTIEDSDPRIFEETVLNSIKSISYTNPVTLPDISGTAIEIVADDQLNGAVDQFNVVLSSLVLDYDASSGEWIERVTSNPASLYRHILQSPANARPLSDAEIDIATLEEWHTYCEARGYTYNRYIDFETSVIAMLRDVAAAGAASPTIMDGVYGVVIDRAKTDIVQMITPHNSWDFKADLQMPDLPHAFRVEFRNADAGYVMDERIVYADGYDSSNATLFEQLQYLSTTNAELAYKHARRFLATATLRPEVYSVMMDLENLVATRGDRVKVLHDVPLIGAGSGRIKSLTLSVGSPQYINAFVLDEAIEVATEQSYSARVRTYTGTEYFAITPTTTGTANTFNITTPLLNGTIEVDMLCGIMVTGNEMDAIISRIEPQADLTARVTFLDYAPEIFDAETGTIPPFVTNVTVPLSLQRPLPPLLEGEPLSGESVMLRASDGTVTSRMVIRLNNRNEGLVQPVVKVRVAGGTQFENAKLLQASADSVSLTDLTDAARYDIHIRYRRSGSSLLSAPLELNNVRFDGGSALPADVTGFKVNISGGLALFEWNANADIDLSHYVVKFSRAFSGVTWDTAQVLKASVKETQLAVPFIGGTYLIKAVDILGNQSVNAVTVVTYDSQAPNVVQTITEHPAFSGTKDNVESTSGYLQLIDTSAIGYYYFNGSTDLDAVFVSQISASIQATGANINRVRDFTSVRAQPSIRGASFFIRSVASIRSLASVRGIAAGSWSVTLQIRITNDDPTGTPTWSAWEDFVAGSKEFWGAEYRLKLESSTANVTPRVAEASVTVDMPDRIERGDDVNIPIAGLTVTFASPFKATPNVQVTIQNGATDDRIEITSKNASGFTCKVYNATSAGYVSRTADYLVTGYGRG